MNAHYFTDLMKLLLQDKYKSIIIPTGTPPKIFYIWGPHILDVSTIIFNLMHCDIRKLKKTYLLYIKR